MSSGKFSLGTFQNLSSYDSTTTSHGASYVNVRTLVCTIVKERKKKKKEGKGRNCGKRRRKKKKRKRKKKKKKIR